MRDEPVATAAIVLTVSLAFTAAGAALLLVGGLAIAFAVILLAFGVSGMVQAIMIAFGRRDLSRGTGEQPPEDEL